MCVVYALHIENVERSSQFGQKNVNFSFFKRMKTITCLFVLVAMSMASPPGKYTDRYDNINLEDIMSNKRLLNAYMNCLLEKGKCTADGRELKSHISEALETRCAKCTDAQRRGTRRMIGHLINHEPQFWNQLTAKYDPQRKYTKHYEDELRTVKA